MPGLQLGLVVLILERGELLLERGGERVPQDPIEVEALLRLPLEFNPQRGQQPAKARLGRPPPLSLRLERGLERRGLVGLELPITSV